MRIIHPHKGIAVKTTAAAREEGASQGLECSECLVDTSPLPVPEMKAIAQVSNTQGVGLEVLFEITRLSSPTLQIEKLRPRQRW